jgi:hypothetical protein
MKNPGHHLQRIDLSGSTLWLQYFNRELVSFDLHTGEFQIEKPPFISPVDDFFLLPGGRVIVVMKKGDIWVNTAGDWEFLTEIPFSGLSTDHTRISCPRVNRPGFGMVPLEERAYRMMIQEDEIVVVSPCNLYRYSLDTGEWRVIPLSDCLLDAAQISMAAGPGIYLFLGFNRGELQGGLKLVSRDSGQLVTIDGRLPVTGIVPDPSMNGAMIVSAGCCHRSLDFGGLYRVFNGKIEPLYLESAIFDLKLSGNCVYAAGKGNILNYDGKRIISGNPGKFSDLNGLKCSDTTKKSFQVCTDINQIVSQSGLTPLLAVRR